MKNYKLEHAITGHIITGDITTVAVEILNTDNNIFHISDDFEIRIGKTGFGHTGKAETFVFQGDSMDQCYQYVIDTASEFDANLIVLDADYMDNPDLHRAIKAQSEIVESLQASIADLQMGKTSLETEMTILHALITKMEADMSDLKTAVAELQTIIEGGA